MKDFLRKLHLWLSIPFGVLISLICLTGAIMIVEKSVIRPANHALLNVVPSGSPMEMEQLCQHILAEQPEGAKISGVTIFSEPNRSYEVMIAKPYRRKIYVDQYRGVVLGTFERSPFFKKVSLLHRRMLDGSDEAKVGKEVIGITVLSFVVILISGVVLWCPRKWRHLRRSLRLRFDKGTRPLMYDLHVTLGVFATLFLLGCGITGLTWVYDWFEKPLYTLLGAVPPAKEKPHVQTKSIGEGYEAWGKAIKSLCKEQYASLYLRKGEIEATLKGWGNHRASDDYYFDEVTGEVTGVVKYADKSRYKKVKGWISTIHLGRWGGDFSRWLTFFALLIGAVLPWTGYYLWWRRLYRRRRNTYK